jgi:hypothetical protein
LKLRLPVVIAVAAVLVAAGAAPALAADSGPAQTSATFALSGGDLTLTAMQSATLSSSASGDTDIIGKLGAVSVSDLRGGTQAWAVSAASTDFVGTGARPTHSQGITYRAGMPSVTGNVNFPEDSVTARDSPLASTGPSTVVDPNSVYGNNTATWNPKIVVRMPANALADNYSATITTSIL